MVQRSLICGLHRPSWQGWLAYAPGRMRRRSLRDSAQGRLFAPPEKRLCSGWNR